MIDAEGECEVTAGSIKADSDLEILDPDWHIASLGEGAKFRMELTFDKGRGYVPADRNKTGAGQNIIGVIPVDSIYTPVLKANYTVEKFRVGQNLDDDKVILEVQTNKVVTAREAVARAASILISHFSVITETIQKLDSSIEAIDQPFGGADGDDSDRDKGRPDIWKMPIEELDFSVRSFNCLKRANINTVGDLISKTADELMKVRNMGQKSLEEVEKKLHELGLSLKSADEN